jgi:hypothetical protein
MYIIIEEYKKTEFEKALNEAELKRLKAKEKPKNTRTARTSCNDMRGGERDNKPYNPNSRCGNCNGGRDNWG